MATFLEFWKKQFSNRRSWTPERDIYDSVLAAAFGCVRIKGRSAIGQACETDLLEELRSRVENLEKCVPKAEHQQHPPSQEEQGAGEAPLSLPLQALAPQEVKMQLAEMIRRIAAVEAQAIVAPLIANKDVKTDNAVPQEVEVKVHPILLFIPCVILFMVQSTFLLGLLFSLDPSADFMRKAEEESVDDMLMIVKCCMVGVLQLMSLKELSVAMRGLYTAYNPWLLCRHMNFCSKCSEVNDMERNLPRDWARHLLCNVLVIYHLMITWLLCMFAKIMQLLVAVMCLRMGLNIILQANTVQDAIFNGLVLGFITDLDEAAFAFIATTWNIDGKAYDEFEVPPDELKGEGDQDVSNHNGLQHEPINNEFIRGLVNFSPSFCSSVRTFFFFVQGSTDMIALGFCWVLYMSQIFDFMLAVESGVLPVVRDLCYQMRVRDPHAAFEESGGPSILTTRCMMIVIDLSFWMGSQEQFDRLGEVTFNDNKAGNLNFKERCLAAENAGEDEGIYEKLYSSLSFHEVAVLWRKYNKIAPWIALLLFVILITPPVIERTVIAEAEDRKDGRSQHARTDNRKYTEYKRVPMNDERVTKAGSPSQEPSSARTSSPLLENGGDREQS